MDRPKDRFIHQSAFLFYFFMILYFLVKSECQVFVLVKFVLGFELCFVLI